jgi:hypothetical protein
MHKVNVSWLRGAAPSFVPALRRQSDGLRANVPKRELDLGVSAGKLSPSIPALLSKGTSTLLRQSGSFRSNTRDRAL